MDLCYLVATPMTDWPVALRGTRIQPLSLQAFLDDPGGLAERGLLWLGYGSPLLGMQRALQGSDPDRFLDTWGLAAQAFVECRRIRPERCRLVNLPLLGLSGLEQLRAEAEAWQDAGGTDRDADAGEDPASLVCRPESALAGLLIRQRRELELLYADLEAQADLFGREPEFQLPLPACNDPALGRALLQEWQRRPAGGAAMAGRRAAVLAERVPAGADLAHDEPDLREALLCMEANYAAEVERGAAAEAEAAALLQEAAEEKELVLLQLRQIQDELITTFQELQSCQETRRLQTLEIESCRQQAAELSAELQRLRESSERSADELRRARQREDQDAGELEALCQRLARQQGELDALEQECGHLFLHSHFKDGLERHRIPRILELMRRNLQG